MSQKTRPAILLVGFGGPTPGCCGQLESCPGEAYCFVKKIVGNKNPARIDEVVEHYRAVGGFSNYNAITFAQASALETELQRRKIDLPVFVGMRNWKPYLHETIDRIVKSGHDKIFGIVLSPFQSWTSWERYHQNVADAIETLQLRCPPTIEYLEPWYLKNGFLEAIKDRINSAVSGWSSERFQQATLIFTAHGIPMKSVNSSPYVEQFRKVADRVAKMLQKDFELAFQSQPENSPIPWTQPSLAEVIQSVANSEVKDIIVSPIGFLCDHVEVVYDLDREAKSIAEECNLNFVRVGTVADHHLFIEMLADELETLEHSS